ncbi:MAG: TIGR00730 family Rossman fold protein [Eubacteriales bacterium]|nr:TIGR00730 family Rossman fold protein [Eubacteriales bacterium]
MGKLTICVYGAASEKIAPVFITETENLGEEIARRHHSIIYGGGAEGVMGACARGAAKAQGEVIGVVPFFMDEFEEINHKCTEIIRTKTMGERKEIMEKRADAFIIAPGGIGTLDEFFQILTLVELGQKQAPIILYNVDNYYDELLSYVRSCIEKGFIRKRVENLVHICSTPTEVLSAIESYFSNPS